MMEPSKDAISVRLTRLNNQLLNKLHDSCAIPARDELFDVLQVLYDECNSDYMKNNDKNVAAFVDKNRRGLLELKKLRVNLSDFDVRSVIGRGHFGEVHMVKERQTGDVYAMKTVRKYENSEQKCAAFSEERNIMAQAKSLWITHLQYAFQDANNLYFIMEYHPGGDLLGLLYRQGGTLPESAATFYLAELLLAINDLHTMGYIHRDIKLDNVLLDRCGHLKLADFGSAAKLNAQGVVPNGSLPVGTPDYIAPEVLQSLEKTGKTKCEYGRECDYWSLGIVAYELTIGSTPFSGSNTAAIYAKIINHSKSLKFPHELALSQSYMHLIKGLLIEQRSRFGYENIVKHSLFKHFDFTNLRNQVPPFVPKISSADDTSNFCDVQMKKKEPNMENFKSKLHFSGRNLPFIGFSFTSESKQEQANHFRTSIMVKDDQVDKLRIENEELHKKLMRSQANSQDNASLEKKLDEKCRKLQSIEIVRDKLERDLATNIAESQALKRTLELERKDRTDLERKALELIKAAKLKWEAAEKNKYDAIQLELSNSQRQCAKLLSDIENLNRQLANALDKANQRKVSIDTVEQLRRSSVIGLESRLEKVTTETQLKIVDLQQKLAIEIEQKATLEKRLNELQTTHTALQNTFCITQKENKEMKNMCMESSELIDALKIEVMRLDEVCEDLEFHKAMVKSLEDDLEEEKNDKTKDEQLQKELDVNLVLKKQINDLKGELNTMRSSKLTSLDEMKTAHESEMKTIEAKLKQLNDDKMEVDIKVQEVMLREKNQDEKIKILEGLLAQAQNDLSKLETGSEREAVLKEQVERLEHQLMELSAAAALEKQELVDVKSKLWRLEKELSNARLDKRIVEREFKDERKRVQDLEKQIKESCQKQETIESTYKKSICELETANEDLCKEKQKSMTEIEKLQEKIDCCREKEAKGAQMIDAQQKIIQEKELKICSLLDVVDTIRCEKLVAEQRCLDLQSEKNDVDKQMIMKSKEINALRNELSKSQSDLENSLLNRKALRDACTLLEDQLIEFETILDCSETKRLEMQSKIEDLQNQIDEHKHNVREARSQCNEEKSMKLVAEARAKKLLDDVEYHQKELESVGEEIRMFKQVSNELSEDLSAMELRIVDQDATLKSYERQIDDLIADNNYLKEENSEQMTFISKLKESKYSLAQQVTDAQDTITILLKKIAEIDMLLNEKMQYFNERDLKADATIQQQTKLIDYLQSKIEESAKKKKTLSDKLFGNSKKENHPPLSMPMNYRDLEQQLSKEQRNNKLLHQEIIKLKAESYKEAENDAHSKAMKSIAVSDAILSQIVCSPASQKNDLYRQNSIQRMHHNIPHRFESKLCTKHIKCAHCSNQILLGRHLHVCRECSIVAHTNCANSLPTTCGLPDEYARHYSDSLSKLSSASSLNISEVLRRETVSLEGWIKIPNLAKKWERHYACLTETILSVFKEPPNVQTSSENNPVQVIKLHNAKSHGKLIFEPLSSEIPIAVANSDLPFVIKVETSPNSTCWPSQCLIFMSLSVEDKEKWQSALQNIFKCENDLIDVVLADTEDLELNSIVDVTNETKLLGTDSGLFTLQRNKCIKIAGPSHVYEIVQIGAINVVVMIAEENRTLISCDLKHLLSLCDCAPCTMPSLTYRNISVKSMDGFHVLKASVVSHKSVICAANMKKLTICVYDEAKKEFQQHRILDTAQPTSCMIFTEHSLIIGADKFFEIDLNSYEADEFLDASDVKLSQAVTCFQLNSYPLSIQLIAKAPIEYLVCFNEFAVFVDDFGRSTRMNEISWSCLPKAFFYSTPYLYILQFNALEIYKIAESTGNGDGNEALLLIKIDMHGSYVGCNENGVYLQAGKQIKYVNARRFDDCVSMTSETTTECEQRESDRFSFTSSMVQEGELSDDEKSNQEMNYANRRVKFTDL